LERDQHTFLKLRTYITVILNTFSRWKVIYHWLIMLIIEKKITRFRISRHQLIETGRYTCKNITAHLRICQHCNANDIGDEMHFLLFCNKYNRGREDLLEVVNKECCIFSQLLPKVNLSGSWVMRTEKCCCNYKNYLPQLWQRLLCIHDYVCVRVSIGVCKWLFIYAWMFICMYCTCNLCKNVVCIYMYEYICTIIFLGIVTLGTRRNTHTVYTKYFFTICNNILILHNMHVLFRKHRPLVPSVAFYM
jgi:hypothetical protein